MSLYGASIIAFCLGGVIAAVVTAAAQVQDNMVKSVVIILACLLGFYLGQTYNKYMKSIGTAILGAFLISRGVASYDPKAPSIFTTGSLKVDDVEFDADQLKDKRTIAYLAFVVVFSCIGSFVQLKFIAPPDEDKDDMFHPDNA